MSDFDKAVAVPLDIPVQKAVEPEAVAALERSAKAAKAARKPALVAAKTSGALKAEAILQAAAIRQGIVPPTPIVRAEELVEDWQEAAALEAKPPPDPELAGIYRVTHGELHFGNVFDKDGKPLGQKIVRSGYRVKLSAVDAQAFLEQRCVQFLGPDPNDAK